VRLSEFHSHVSLDHWSRHPGWLQRRDPRAKIVAALVLLFAVSFLPVELIRIGLLLAALALLTALAGLPVAAVIRRALWVLPFSAVFAGVTAIAGDTARAVAILVRTLCSAWVVVILAGTTPLEDLLAGLRGLGAPPFFLVVVQFVWRYLFVIADQAHRMHLAAHARGSHKVFHARAGSVAVLFARAYQRAEGTYRAMLARGFRGTLPRSRPLRFTLLDAAIVTSALGIAVCLVEIARR